MVIYLSLEAISERFRGTNIPEQIPITKNLTTIGNTTSNDVRILLDESQQGYFAIYKEEEGQYYIRTFQLPIFVNDMPIYESSLINHKDRIRIGDDYLFYFIHLRPLGSSKDSITQPSEGAGGKTAVLKFRPPQKTKDPGHLLAVNQQQTPPLAVNQQQTPPLAVNQQQTPPSLTTTNVNDTAICPIISHRPVDSETVKLAKGIVTVGLKPITHPTIPTQSSPTSLANSNQATNPSSASTRMKAVQPYSSAMIGSQAGTSTDNIPPNNPPPNVLNKVKLVQSVSVTTIPENSNVANPTNNPPIPEKNAEPKPLADTIRIGSKKAERTEKIPQLTRPLTLPIEGQHKTDKITKMIRPLEAVSEEQAIPSTISSPINLIQTDNQHKIPKPSQLVEPKLEEKKSALSTGSINEFMSSDAQMTLMWQNRSEDEQNVPLIIAPSNGQIIPIIKDKFIIGRSSICDLCLINDYISRQHLEITKITLGFLAKNIGKNDVIVEKKLPQIQTSERKIILEEKILKPGESTILLQEATLILGNQILYFFNIEAQKEIADSSTKDRKCKFYKNLAGQKAELLEAAQLQKLLTPPHAVFEDIKIGIWFKYLAINDLSGDFFLYHKIKDTLYVCLGDVSGHGAAAALLASQISGICKILAEQQNSAEEIVQAINTHLLCLKQPKSKQTIYSLINVLKITVDGIEMCIAGNSVPPLYYKANEKKIISLDTPSTPIGLFGGDKFTTYWDALSFQPNDLLIMFTDGVTEAEMSDDTLLEYDRVRHQIEAQIHNQTACTEFLDIFLAWLRQQSEIRDDLSIVLLAKT